MQLENVSFIPDESLGSFHVAVRKLHRPYQVINQAEQLALEKMAMDANSDVFSYMGRYWTFGSADSGFAIMPIQPEYLAHLPALTTLDAGDEKEPSALEDFPNLYKYEATTGENSQPTHVGLCYAESLESAEKLMRYYFAGRGYVLKNLVVISLDEVDTTEAIVMMFRPHDVVGLPIDTLVTMIWNDHPAQKIGELLLAAKVRHNAVECGKRILKNA